MNRSQQLEILSRIHAALEATRSVFERFTPGAIETEYKVGHDPVTEADRAVAVRGVYPGRSEAGSAPGRCGLGAAQ